MSNSFHGTSTKECPKGTFFLVMFLLTKTVLRLERLGFTSLVIRIMPVSTNTFFYFEENAKK